MERVTNHQPIQRQEIAGPGGARKRNRVDRFFSHLKSADGETRLSFTRTWDRALVFKEESEGLPRGEWVRIKVPSKSGKTTKAGFVAKESLQKQYGFSSEFIDSLGAKSLAREVEKAQYQDQFNGLLKTARTDEIGLTKEQIREVGERALATMVDEGKSFYTDAVSGTKQSKPLDVVVEKGRGKPFNLGYLDKELGRGGSAIAIRVSSVFENGRSLVIKRPRFATSKTLQQLVEEGNTIAKVRSRGTQKKSPAVSAPHNRESWLIGPYYDKGALRDLLKQGNLSNEEIIYNTERLFVAVEATHQKNIIHRDIKPENIFVAELNGKQKIYLADWGSARDVREMRLGAKGTDDGVTMFYYPVEELQDYDGDKRLSNEEFQKWALSCDVFATGMTLAQLWTGDGGFTPFESSRFGFLSVRKGWQPGAKEKIFEAAKARFGGDAELAERLVRLIEACGNPSYTKRPTAAEAAQEYRDILTSWGQKKG